MPFSRVAIFQFKPGTADQVVRGARESLLPRFQETPGFLWYDLVLADGDRGVAVGTWQTREQAERGLRQADEWLKKEGSEITVSRDEFIGEGILHYDAATASTGGKAGISVIEALYAAFNAKDLSRVARLAEPSAKVTNVAFGVELPLRDYMQNWATAFPDSRIEATNFIESSDGVLCEYIGRGTHTGTLQTPMGPIAPTNKCVEVHFAEVYKLRNGKVASARVYFNAASFLRQLGLAPEMAIPPPGRAGASRPEVRH